MPNTDPKIGLAPRGEDETGIVGPNTRQRVVLIGHPLSLQPIREGLARLSRISAPPPSPEITGGGLTATARQHLSLEWDGMRERMCF
jgi:hypothetical protein